MLDLPADALFTAVTLFDLYCQHLPVDQCVRALPCVCCAIARLVKKNDDAAAGTIERHNWLHIASHMTTWLKKLGHDQVDAPTLKDIRREERAVLVAMDWQLSPPTIYSWLMAFCTRLDGLTQSEYTVCVQWVWGRGFPFATHLMPVVSFAEVAPRVLATGIFSLLLASAGLLELRDLRSELLGEDEWLQLFAQSQPLAIDPPRCALEEGRREQFANHFHDAIGCNAVAVKQYSHEAACALRKALASPQPQTGKATH